MTLIKTVPPEAASGEIAEIYAQMHQAMGSVPAIFQMWSASPAQLRNQWEWVSYHWTQNALSPAFLAAVRLMVSVDRECDYCIGMNEGLLVGMFGWSAEQVAALKADPAQANLAPHERDLLVFVLAAVRDPHAVKAADLDALRAQGLSDQAIFDAVVHGARMVAGDLVANVFKVERDF
jgi:uncharacterized peroxidase-related enzyme